MAFVNFSVLFDANDTPTKDLLELLKVLGVEHDGTLAGIRDVTQQEWFKPDLLRGEIGEEHGDLKSLVEPILHRMRLRVAIPAPPGNYDYCLVLGGFIVAIRKRLAYAHKQWQAGAKFTRLVTLGGARPINPAKGETKEGISDPNNGFLPIRDGWNFNGIMPSNEGELMRLIALQADLPAWTFIDVHAPLFPERERPNPNTRDTAQQWFDDFAPRPGRVLVVSSQPYVLKQHSDVASVLPDDFEVVTCGYECPASIPLTRDLDNIAKAIFSIAEARGV